VFVVGEAGFAEQRVADECLLPFGVGAVLVSRTCQRVGARIDDGGNFDGLMAPGLAVFERASEAELVRFGRLAAEDVVVGGDERPIGKDRLRDVPQFVLFNSKQRVESSCCAGYAAFGPSVRVLPPAPPILAL
jgi:hypothetical protein